MLDLSFAWIQWSLLITVVPKELMFKENRKFQVWRESSKKKTKPQDGCFGEKNKASREGQLELHLKKSQIYIKLICKMHCKKSFSLQSPYFSYLTRETLLCGIFWTNILFLLSQLLTSAFQKEIYTMSQTRYTHRLTINKLALELTDLKPICSESSLIHS